MDAKVLFYFLGALLSGFLIGLGDIVYVVSENHLVGAFLFSLGLLTILIKGYPLYTGRIGFIASLGDLYQPMGGMIMMLLVNLLGISLICSLANASRLDLSAVDAIVPTKFGQSFISTLFLSWGCGGMMYIAVYGWRKYTHPLYVILPIMFFILCGFEHCIANFGYLAMWIWRNGLSVAMQRVCDLSITTLLNFLIMVVGNALGSLTFSKVELLGQE